MWCRGRVARQRTANPRTAVRLRPTPPETLKTHVDNCPARLPLFPVQY